jgi:dolichol-phosphate mannosyltransferase
VEIGGVDAGPRLTIVSPVYQSEACVAELCRRLRLAVTQVVKTYEIILVDDGSTDRSWEAIVTEAALGDVRGIRLARNVGQHRAITAGLDHAKGDWVVVIDCDLQDPPEAIADLYRKAQEGFEVVVARFEDRVESRRRQVVSRAFWRLLSYLSDAKFDPRVGNYRIMSRRVVANFIRYREQSRLLGGVIAIMGFEVGFVSVPRGSRFAGDTTYSPRKLLAVAVDLTLTYSDKPLRLSVWAGALIALAALLAGVAVIIAHLVAGFRAPGWASIMVSLYFLGGVIIANLGLIGTYVGRTFDESKKRPLYIIADETS